MCLGAPKIPAPTPVVQRQPFQDPVSRASLMPGDAQARQQFIAGIATSTQGIASPASTTKRVLAGGDQQIAPVLDAGGGAGVGAPSTGQVAPIGGGGSSDPAAAKKKAMMGSLPLAALAAQGWRPYSLPAAN